MLGPDGRVAASTRAAVAAAVQAAAGWVTSSNADDGVARALVHLGLCDRIDPRAVPPPVR